MRIYIASPYTIGDPLANVRRQIDAAEQLAAKGHVPILPLLSHYWDEVYQHPWEFWIAQCLSHLVTADAVLRLPGVSVGADIEVREARNINLPIYFRIEDVPDGDVVANTNNLKISSSAVEVRPIEWGDEQPPNKDCGYNHVVGKTPLGDILVTWKGWKDDPYYSTDDWVFGHFGGYSLDEAKQTIQSEYNRIVLSCVIPDDGNVAES